MKKSTFLMITLFVGAIWLAAFTSGPEGTEISKFVPEYIQSASQNAGFNIIEERTLIPESVALPFRVALKRKLKHVAGVVGVTVNETEYATLYVVLSADAQTRIYCSIRSVGDHVIGIVVSVVTGNEADASRFRAELNKAFPHYQIL